MYLVSLLDKRKLAVKKFNLWIIVFREILTRKYICDIFLVQLY